MSGALWPYLNPEYFCQDIAKFVASQLECHQLLADYGFDGAAPPKPLYVLMAGEMLHPDRGRVTYDLNGIDDPNRRSDWEQWNLDRARCHEVCGEVLTQLRHGDVAGARRAACATPCQVVYVCENEDELRDALQRIYDLQGGTFDADWGDSDMLPSGDRLVFGFRPVYDG